MKTFLFSIDLEEFVPADPATPFRRAPLPELAEAYLELLRRHRMRATFFVVGEIALRFPALVRAIASEGHELACHTHAHVPLDRQTPASLGDDLRRNLDAVGACAARPVAGFRAPILSLTERSRWAYEVLAELGFRYSSSVLPAGNPLYGWPSFGEEPRSFDGVWEIPVTVARLAAWRLPPGAGTYFRCLPFPFIRRSFKRCAREGRAVAGYFHPYDLDTEQERVLSGGVRGSRTLNALLYLNRSQTLPRLEALLADGFRIVPYHEFIADRFPDLAAAGH